MADQLSYTERLDVERDRDGKAPLTAAERMRRLINIRDGSLIWAESCVANGTPKGSASATDMYVFARDEIDRIENDASAGASTRVPWTYAEWPMDGAKPETPAN